MPKTYHVTHERDVLHVLDRESSQRVEPELVPLTCLRRGCEHAVFCYSCGKCKIHDGCQSGEA